MRKQPLHYPKRTCAVCGATSGKLLFEQRFAAMSGGGLLSGYDIVVCRSCGFAYADHIPDQAAFDEYYREMSKYEFEHQDGQESPFNLARFREIVDIIKPYLHGPTARIVDIGCATGGLLALLKEAGFPNVRGVDPSPRCAATAQRLHGIPVLTGTLSDLPIEPRSADFIILTGVLEHVQDVRAALQRLRVALNETGRLYIEVPDATRFADSPNAPFQEFSTEHINFYSPVSLASLLAAEGFVQLFSQRHARVPNHNTVEPAVSAIFESSSGLHAEMRCDAETEAKLCQYINRSQAADDSVRRVIDGLVGRATPVLVWGVGTHTQRLLASSNLSQARIRAFIDSNPRYQGKELNGIPILPPSELRRRTEAVLISSRVYQREISQYIRTELKVDNDLILLY